MARGKDGAAKARRNDAAEAGELAKVLQFSDFVNRPRPPRRSTPEVELPAIDEAMRNLHAAALAAMRLVALTRDRLGLPQL